MVDQSKLLEYLNITRIKHQQEYAEKYPNLAPPQFSINFGKKYGKVIRQSGSSRSVHCFVDLSNGDLYKAATWKAPAKGVRGNISDDNPPIFGKDFYIKY